MAGAACRCWIQAGLVFVMAGRAIQACPTEARVIGWSAAAPEFKECVATDVSLVASRYRVPLFHMAGGGAQPRASFSVSWPNLDSKGLQKASDLRKSCVYVMSRIVSG